MVTKYKAAVFIIAAMFSSIASAAYTTMTLEGVKQVNGVWTAAGVVDNMGFVKTTGQLTVTGKSISTAVSLPVDRVASSAILRSTSKLLGPVALAAAAYDVYNWIESSPDISVQDNSWVSTVIDTTASANSISLVYNYNRGGQLCTSCSMSTAIQIIQDSQYSSGAYVYRPFSVTSVGPAVYEKNFNHYKVVSSCVMNSSNSNCVITSYYLANPYLSGVNSAFEALGLATLAVIANGFNNIPSLKGQPIPIGGLQFPPFSEWSSDPYFKDGNWYRDRMDISPAPTPTQPNRVKIDFGPVKVQGATDPNVVPDTGTAGGNGTAPQPEKEKPTFCEANPMSIACAEMGGLKEEKLEVEERPVDVSYTPWGSSTSQCPADKIIPLWEGQSISISYSPVCQFASLLRPLVIALAFVAAGFIVAGITRKGAES
ncbi:virulence factor TspB C-terminal domain-related protein [Aeromonas sp. QDB62]|uniref:virulence factor TspB C-terminal domain-related protein n=1 Tax=Aeromonas sp. QDB62 TaxID=2990499 RepID=UPI0022E7D74D|nr:virulence factor TspB C-terminal domain-related protein [Aeromonas sp. QDB62]